MIREVNLLSHLPEYVQEYQEIFEIMKTENPELQLSMDESEIIKNNLFILTCNETGIARFEKLLGIFPEDDDSLEARIARVLVRWNDGIPYTYRGLLRKLDAMCGQGNYEALPNWNDYELYLTTHFTLSGQVSELDRLLEKMIPANIAVICWNKLQHTIEGQVYMGATTVTTNKFEIDSKQNEGQIADGLIRLAGHVSTLIKQTIN